MTEVNIDNEGWSAVPNDQEFINITKDSISAPWSAHYSVIDQSHILVNQQTIKVDLTKKEMIFSQDGDSLKLKRLN